MASQRVKVSIGRTFNTGNYESIRIDVGAEADVLDGMNNDMAFEELCTDCLERLNKEAESLGLKKTGH